MKLSQDAYLDYNDLVREETLPVLCVIVVCCVERKKNGEREGNIIERVFLVQFMIFS